MFCFVFSICIYIATTFLLNLLGMVREDSGRDREIKASLVKLSQGVITTK